MSTKPRPHDDALLPMTEEEERRLHKKAIMDKKDLLDYSLYLFDAGFLKWFFNDPNAFKELDLPTLIIIIGSLALVHRANTIGKFYEEDVRNKIFKFFNLNDSSKSGTQLPKVSYTRKNNHILISSHEYQGEEQELPQKITIYRAKKNKIPSQKRNNKRTLFNNKK